MRRLIALLLLAIMPFQFGWAAAAAYCGHEATAQACYFGHHDHQHRDGPQAGGPGPSGAASAAAATTVDAVQSAPATVDGDCSQCHFSALKVLATADVASHPEAVQSAQGLDHQRLRSRAQDRLERPKWPLA